jgi:hypothetical protein
MLTSKSNQQTLSPPNQPEFLQFGDSGELKTRRIQVLVSLFFLVLISTNIDLIHWQTTLKSNPERVPSLREIEKSTPWSK